MRLGRMESRGWRRATGRALAACPVALALAAVLPSGPAPAAAAQGTTARARFLMGTRLSIETDEPAPPAALEAAFDEVSRLEDVLSNWRATSEISRLNRDAAQTPVRCSEDLFDALDSALHWARLTDGAFDPTVEPLVRALGLRNEEGRALVAGEGALTAQLPIGWRHVRIDRRRRSVAFDAPGVGLDLGGIGKGIALDAAARVLRGHGVRRALIDFGGQVLAVGRPRGFPGWLVGVADPEERERAIDVLRVDGISVATSGNSERAVETPGGTVGHILDPAARAPASFAGSVTVAMPDATSADALSTALFVMGPVRGFRWADARHVAALYLWRDGSGALQSKATRVFEGLRLSRGPGE